MDHYWRRLVVMPGNVPGESFARNDGRAASAARRDASMSPSEKCNSILSPNLGSTPSVQLCNTGNVHCVTYAPCTGLPSGDDYCSVLWTAVVLNITCGFKLSFAEKFCGCQYSASADMVYSKIHIYSYRQSVLTSSYVLGEVRKSEIFVTRIAISHRRRSR